MKTIKNERWIPVIDGSKQRMIWSSWVLTRLGSVDESHSMVPDMMQLSSDRLLTTELCQRLIIVNSDETRFTVHLILFHVRKLTGVLSGS